MSIWEPVVDKADLHAVLPEQRRGTDVEQVSSAESALNVVDHVSSHAITCYWDYVECRWQCTRP